MTSNAVLTTDGRPAQLFWKNTDTRHLSSPVMRTRNDDPAVSNAYKNLPVLQVARSVSVAITSCVAFEKPSTLMWWPLGQS